LTTADSQAPIRLLEPKARAFAQKVTEILRSIPFGYGGNKRLALKTTKHPGTIGRYRRGGCPDAWYGLVELAASHPAVLECILNEVGRTDLVGQVQNGPISLANANSLAALVERVLEGRLAVTAPQVSTLQNTFESGKEKPHFHTPGELDCRTAIKVENQAAFANDCCELNQEEATMDMKTRISVIADLYRQARAAGDQKMMGVAEATMMEAMVAESAIARVAIGESLIAEALRAK